MDVRADGPYEVGSLVFVSPAGDFTLTVVAKATFRLAPETSPLVTEGREPLFLADVHWDDDPQWSLRAASDLVPFKRSPEVLVTGSAHAAGGKAVRAAMVRVVVGAMNKALEVQGDCCFNPDGSLAEAAPWTRMPLVWERAAGGPGTVNPVGVPTGQAAYPDTWGRIFLPNLWPPWTSISEPGEAIAPVGLGPCSADWPGRIEHLRTRLTWDRPLPADFDGAYFNAAPADQRLAEITGAETIVLEHLHPRHARLVTRLAPATPVGVVEAPGVAPFALPLACDTLWIDTDRGLATLTFRGHATLDDPEQPGTIVVRPRADSHPPAPADNRPRRQETVELVMPSAPAPAHARRDTVEIVMPAGAPPETWGFGGLTPPSATAPAQRDTLGERLAAAQVTLAQVLHGKPLTGERPPEAVFVPPPTEASEAVQPPPLWVGTPESDAPPDTARNPVLPETPALAEGPPPLPVEAYPLARCAAIAASLDARPAEAPAILAKESLDQERWDELSSHWDAAIEKELSRHKNKLLREHDAAYVARIEEERGPLAAGDYARLAAAAELHQAAPALLDLRIPAAAWPRIRRVWIQLLARDRKLAAIVQSFLESERDR